MLTNAVRDRATTVNNYVQIQLGRLNVTATLASHWIMTEAIAMVSYCNQVVDIGNLNSL